MTSDIAMIAQTPFGTLTVDEKIDLHKGPPEIDLLGALFFKQVVRFVTSPEDRTIFATVRGLHRMTDFWAGWWNIFGEVTQCDPRVKVVLPADYFAVFHSQRRNGFFQFIP